MAKKRIRLVAGRNQDAEQILPEESFDEIPLPVDEGSPIHCEEPEARESELTDLGDEFRNESDVREPTAQVHEVHDPLDVSKLTPSQKYAVRTMLTFADCAVQKDMEGIFHVLARNFASAGELSWFLIRINHKDKIKYGKGKDLIDYMRVISRELFRDLKAIGKPVARW
jgi:hypothetical protein